MKRDYSKKQVEQYVGRLVAKSMPKGARISDKIQYFALEAYKQDISDWTDARLQAIDPIIPDWTDLIRVYDDVMVDSHVAGIIRSIIKKIQAKKWKIYNDDDTVNDDLTDIFSKAWFKDYITLVVMSDMYPFSVIQLGDWDNGFNELEEIKREYYTPQYNTVKSSLYVYANDKSGFDLDNPEYSPYFVVLKSDEELGLLDHVAPLALGKKHMLIYWWRFGEQYGLPFRIGKTDADDNTRRRALENAFKNMGSNMWLVADKDDEIDFKSVSDNNANVFIENLNYSNNEISKIIGGSTGIFDPQSFVGSAEAGERLFNEITGSYCSNIEDNVNSVLLKRISEVYNDVRFKNKKFKFENTEYVSYENKLKTIEVLDKSFKLDPEEVQAMFGLKVEAKDIISNIQNKYNK